MRASRSRAGFATALLAVMGLPACDSAVETPLEPQIQLGVWGRSSGETPLSVYTQNVYLGGDTGPLFAIDLTNVPLVVAATNTFWGAVQSSEGPERAAAIVDEIEARRPHLVGLQEVLAFAVLNAEFQPTGAGLDFLAEIETEIADRDLPYETLLVQDATSSALPLAVGATGVTQWLSFTDRVVTLRRTDVEIVGLAKGNYTAFVPLGSIQFKRGWTRASVEHGSTTYHFVTTQLETQQIPQVQALQAAELLGSVVAGLEGVTIISGDLNSDAEGGPGDPAWTPTYESLIDAGFFDVWHTAPPAHRGEGLTCCHAKDLVTPMDFDQRIDFVLFRSSGDSDAWALERGLFRAEVVGEEPLDRTESGRWPSDHAGLLASLRAVL